MLKKLRKESIVRKFAGYPIEYIQSIINRRIYTGYGSLKRRRTD